MMASPQEVQGFCLLPAARAHTWIPREIGLRTCEQLLQCFGVCDGGCAWGGRWGCWGLCSPSGDIDFNQMSCLQHGHSLALHHLQELWGHLRKWQVRWRLGWSHFLLEGKARNRDLGAL